MSDISNLPIDEKDVIIAVRSELAIQFLRENNIEGVYIKNPTFEEVHNKVVYSDNLSYLNAYNCRRFFSVEYSIPDGLTEYDLTYKEFVKKCKPRILEFKVNCILDNILNLGYDRYTDTDREAFRKHIRISISEALSEYNDLLTKEGVKYTESDILDYCERDVIYAADMYHKESEIPKSKCSVCGKEFPFNYHSNCCPDCVAKPFADKIRKKE